jgi:hypothetical protein
MGEVLSRFVQTLQLRRDAFVWMDFNDRATGDALILVALTPVVTFLLLVGGGLRTLFTIGIFSLFLRMMLGALIQWLLYSGITWAIVHFGLKAGGEYSTYLRFTGFAYPTTILVVVIALIVRSLNLIVLILGFAWFVVIVGRGTEYASDVPRDRALLVAIGALVALLVVDRIFSLTPIA